MVLVAGEEGGWCLSQLLCHSCCAVVLLSSLLLVVAYLWCSDVDQCGSHTVGGVGVGCWYE